MSRPAVSRPVRAPAGRRRAQARRSERGIRPTRAKTRRRGRVARADAMGRGLAARSWGRGCDHHSSIGVAARRAGRQLAPARHVSHCSSVTRRSPCPASDSQRAAGPESFPERASRVFSPRRRRRATSTSTGLFQDAPGSASAASTPLTATAPWRYHRTRSFAAAGCRESTKVRRKTVSSSTAAWGRVLGGVG